MQINPIKTTIQNFFKESSAELFSYFTLIAVYLYLSIVNIGKFSIWFDEAFGTFLIKFNFFDIAKYTAYDVHPPLYYWLLKIWSFIGKDEITLRLMSVFFGVIALTFGYLLVKKLFNKKIALFSLMFAVISPTLIRYSQEARMYTLILAIVFAATYVLVKALESKKRVFWIIYGVLVALGMLTHYFTALFWIAHWTWRFDNIRRLNPKNKIIKEFFSKDWLAAHAIAIGLFAFWLPLFFLQFFVVQTLGFWIPPVTLNTLTSFITNLFVYEDAGKVTGWLSLLIIISISFAAYIGFKVYNQLSFENRSRLRLLIYMTLIPVVLLFIISMPPMRPYFIDRYLFASVVMTPIVFAIIFAFAKTNNKINYLIKLILIFISILGITNVYNLGNYNKNTNQSNNTREVMQLIVDKSSNKEPIIVNNQYFFYEAVFYESSANRVHFISTDKYYGSVKMLENESDHKIKDLKAFVRKNPIIWYVGRSGSDELNAPFSCKPIETINFDDTITGEPAYKAIKCDTR